MFSVEVSSSCQNFLGRFTFPQVGDIRNGLIWHELLTVTCHLGKMGHIKLPFIQVDVFSTGSFTGNPLAIVGNADNLSTTQMQNIARWLNLSETAFLSAPTTTDGDYRVRIFTRTEELPFAGHPTLGSARAWLEFGGKPQRHDVLVQECAAGLITIQNDNSTFPFQHHLSHATIL
ncbi:PhzF family phenazine biosynthesis protein [Corynebacterium diphtheriae]|uniref:PhzF family phenazine biosynthesis protein n=2 Tax=Corynebacterium diphtheriae TaxID=1717 RepID=UPI0002468266|nr:PhzF family phenazine biosynthesis isomerase [Corynebacterium diphtheriae]AEX71055.1 phenazine biosynthesis-like domain-containing protein [Corynebacterium diphtheriae CDCE 8392]AEX82321.1 phenazine biosynthesis-like domain-containing protein [Corynebacterium diphtheriae VA01]MCS6572346.1 PhzF family phenazine biosynthesis isomerase [Corynebacterium diphtheriae]ODS16151.1 phenazine biosynthesis protein [Corynebacterium diphtheriae]ODS21399.1 phenazine biosynthesis protein [Corynebacterium d